MMSRRGRGAAGGGERDAPGGDIFSDREAEAHGRSSETLFVHNLGSLLPNQILAFMC